MPRSHRFRWLPALALAAAASVVLSSTAVADASPPHRLVSNYETHSGNSLQRDCGFSHTLPNDSDSSIWLFCDTPTANSSGKVIGFITGSTAALGPITAGKVPTGLSEIPSQGTDIEPLPSYQGPQQFLPAPSLVTLPGSSTDCALDPGHHYPATWMSGVTREPSSANASRLLISFTDVCVDADSSQTITSERFGLAEYDPADNTVVKFTRVFKSAAGTNLAPVLLLGSPVFSGGELYLFSFTCDQQDGFGGCTRGRVFLARTGATPSSWEQASSYQFRKPSSPSGWTSDPNAAESIITGAMAVGVTADSYSSLGQGLDLIEETNVFSGKFRVWSASSPVGPWTQKTSGQVPCKSGSGTLNFCRALIGHPELSTSTDLLLSFFDPGTNHVWVTAQAW